MNVEVVQPWHKQFWFWFIFGLPAVVVVASLITVYIAFEGADSLVKDDYYKEGLAINQELGKLKAAKELGISVRLSLDLISGEVFAILSADTTKDIDVSKQNLQIDFIHPTNMSRDFSLSLTQISEQRFSAQLDSKIQGKWYIQIDGLEPEPWQLKTEVVLKDSVSETYEWLIN